MFDIKFDHSSFEDLDSEAGQGEVQIGPQTLKFSSSFEFWSPTDYEQQWLRGVRTILEGGQKSCLVTSITNPANANFLAWLVIYREKTWEDGYETDRLILQKDILLLDDIRLEFDLQTLENYVPDRTEPFIVMDDTEVDAFIAYERTVQQETLAKIPRQEWPLTLEDLRNWYSARRN